MGGGDTMNYGGIGYILFCILISFGGLLVFRKELEVEMKIEKAHLLQQKRPTNNYYTKIIS